VGGKRLRHDRACICYCWTHYVILLSYLGFETSGDLLLLKWKAVTYPEWPWGSLVWNIVIGYFAANEMDTYLFNKIPFIK